jgi:hypothetical protein
MPTRRHFLQTLALTPALLHSRSLLAEAPSAGAGHTALVIGNAAYSEAGLVNSTNDAKAMQTLLGGAGFSVDLQLDARRDAMLEAIDRFGQRVRTANTRLAVFYYAGHGAQLDWRNYLLPVDVSVRSAETLKTGCIDLGLVLDQLAKAQKQAEGKTFVVILDACRDNPFGTAYRPPHKGLSQFDAPVGSLLAYATGPGNVASDGAGRNGLYTEHLVKELSRPDTHIEDALKRVRLNVRLASGGEQIPWESTSLESDVFIFPRATGTLSEEEQERLIEEEITHWGRVKSSRRIEDWVDYLRSFPNGRFSEIAQSRLNRLLVAIERRDSRAPSDQRLPAPPAPTPAAPVIEQPQAPADKPQVSASEDEAISAGEANLPQAVRAAVTVNPYSAGRFPLGRKFSVGDRVVMRESDLLTGIVEGEKRFRVTRVDEDNDRVELNHGKLVLDLMGNTIDSPQASSSMPQQFFPAELQVGQHWTLLYSVTFKKGPFAGKTNQVELDARIRTRETIRVPAGEFQAFRIEATGWSAGERGSTRIEFKLWAVPGINFPIRAERIKRRGNRMIETRLTELVAIRQAAASLD